MSEMGNVSGNGKYPEPPQGTLISPSDDRSGMSYSLQRDGFCTLVRD